MNRLFLIAALIFNASVYASVEVTKEEKDVIYELCSENMGSGEKHALEKKLDQGKIFLSKNYRVSRYESSRRSWDKEAFPLFVRESLLFVCAFNLETETSIVFFND